MLVLFVRRFNFSDKEILDDGSPIWSSHIHRQSAVALDKAQN